MTRYETSVKVNNVPATIHFAVYSPEPDVGYYGGIEEVEVFTPTGRPLTAGLKPTQLDRIIDDLYFRPETWELR